MMFWYGNRRGEMEIPCTQETDRRGALPNFFFFILREWRLGWVLRGWKRPAVSLEAFGIENPLRRRRVLGAVSSTADHNEFS